MKLLCSIISLLVLYLSTVNCCLEDHCDDASALADNCEHSHDHTDDDGNMCSPFLTCGACTGFTLSKVTFVFEKVHFRREKMRTKHHFHFTDDFFAKIWHPPKIS